MRFTVVDDGGTMSFVASGHALKILAAACSRHPSDHRDLIAKAADYDAEFAGAVLAGLSAFDAVRVQGGTVAVGDVLPPDSQDAASPFRVLDEETRRRSMEPARAGLVVFNLRAKRIVQVQNTYADLQRRDRGRLRRDGRPVRALYSYELPAEWSIVP
jgi:hypothetical protein